MIETGPASAVPTPTTPSVPPPFGARLLALPTETTRWREAQARLAAPLASAAARFGALDERLRGAGPGRRLRLAVNETAALSQMAGDRVTAERLAIEFGRGGGDAAGPVARGLAVLRWLCDGTGQAGAAGPLPVMAGLHPIVAAAALFAARPPDEGPAGFLEAAAYAALAGVAGTCGGASFLPQAMGGTLGLMALGDIEERLSRWIAGVEAATVTALSDLDRLNRWRDRAESVVTEFSGRTPARLLAVLEEWPVVTAPLAEQASGASRAAVQRNLDRLCETGLIREITGRDRYRIWTAVL